MVFVCLLLQSFRRFLVLVPLVQSLHSRFFEHQIVYSRRELLVLCRPQHQRRRARFQNDRSPKRFFFSIFRRERSDDRKCVCCSQANRLGSGGFFPWKILKSWCSKSYFQGSQWKILSKMFAKSHKSIAIFCLIYLFACLHVQVLDFNLYFVRFLSFLDINFR